MASLNLHQHDNAKFPSDSHGAHDPGEGGWISLNWGGVRMAMHFDDPEVIRKMLHDAEGQLDEVVQEMANKLVTKCIGCNAEMRQTSTRCIECGSFQHVLSAG